MIINGIRILNVESHRYPKLFHIYDLVQKSFPVEYAVFIGNPFSDPYVPITLYEKDYPIGVCDDITDYIDKKRITINNNHTYLRSSNDSSLSEEEVLYIWNSDLCNKYLDIIGLDYLECYMLTKEQYDHIDLRGGKWVWAYCCYDGDIVHIFSSNRILIKTIENEYETCVADYPGCLQGLYKNEEELWSAVIE